MTHAVSSRVAAEIRAEMGRQGLDQADLAARIGHNQQWVSRRISPTGAITDLSLPDLVAIAEALGKPSGYFVLGLDTATACAQSPSRFTPTDLQVRPAVAA